MKKIMKNKRLIGVVAAVVLVAALLTSGVIATPPAAAGDPVIARINYQGQLTDGQGNPLDGTYNMEFRVYDVELGGAALWSEPQAVAVVNSLFSVQLGQYVSFPADLFDGSDRYLEIVVNGEVLQPRQRLISIPYAIKAEKANDADTLDGLDSSAFLSTGQDWGRSGVASNLYEGTTKLTNRYVNEGQMDSITSAMIANHAVSSDHLDDGAAIGEILDDDGAGSGLDADTLDGLNSSAFLSTGQDWGRSGVASNLYEGTSTLSDKYVNQSGDGMTGSSSSAVLSVTNSGSGPGGEFNSSGGDGVYVDSADRYGLHVASATSSGVRVYSAGGDGVSVYSAGSNGFYVEHAQHSGLNIFDARTDAINVQNAGHNGFYIAHADYTGVYVGSTGLDGIRVANASSCGVRVYSAGHDGVRVEDAGGYGFQVDSASQSGVHVSSAGHDGVRIEDANWSGVYVADAGGDALRVQNAGQDGLRIFNGVGRDYIRAGSDADVDFKVTNTGAAYADGGWQGAADFAELMSTEGITEDYQPGDVLVISDEQDRAVQLSSRPYSSAVIGVYSEEPGFLGSPHVMEDQNGDELPVAVLGIVPCKVSAENGPVHRGDLLTTSSTPGHAMKATEMKLGTMLGKALGELESGTGVIDILVTLQ
ncbi:MAG: hypothetical protein JW732_08985 [Dehalococcoidia bacterium]|nr:hypothetical protein [Dehalococcoidia bacterium]